MFSYLSSNSPLPRHPTIENAPLRKQGIVFDKMVDATTFNNTVGE